MTSSATASIRRLEPAEAALYAGFRLAALARAPAAFSSDPAEERSKPLAFAAARIRDAARPDDFVLGAFAGGELVGTAGFVRGARAKERHKGSVFGMAVAPPAAGAGVGGALMDRLIAEARQVPGLLQLALTVSAGNAAAEALYRRRGFTVFGREPRALVVDGAAVTKLHMVLMLDAFAGPGPADAGAAPPPARDGS